VGNTAEIYILLTFTPPESAPRGQFWGIYALIGGVRVKYFWNFGGYRPLHPHHLNIWRGPSPLSPLSLHLWLELKSSTWHLSKNSTDEPCSWFLRPSSFPCSDVLLLVPLAAGARQLSD